MAASGWVIPADIKLFAGVAAFDFDSTLRVYRKRGFDEELTRPFIRALSAMTNVVIFTNQKDTGAVAAFVEGVGGGVAYRAVAPDDTMRKPHTKVWKSYLAAMAARGYVFSDFARACSFYCGDAAGRPGDHSACDLAFAKHIGLRFIEPEAIFERAAVDAKSAESAPADGGPTDDKFADAKSAADSKRTPAEHSLHSANYNAGYSVATLGALEAKGVRRVENQVAGVVAEVADEKACVLMMGSPGSGKSALCAFLQQEHGYWVVAKDDCTEKNYLQTLRYALRTARVTVVDATHGTLASRAATRAIIAREAPGVKIIVAHVTTPRDLCVHLNDARRELGGRAVPKVAINTYWARLERPIAAGEEGGALVEIAFMLRGDAPREVTEWRY